MASLAAAQEVICVLRQKIAKIEGVFPERTGFGGEAVESSVVLRRQGIPQAARLSTGSGRLDAAIGVFPSPGLMELRGKATRDAGAVAGFALALASLATKRTDRPLLWIGTAEIFREAGRPYAPGVAERFGIPAGRLLLAESRKLTDVLWIAEEAAGLGAFAAVFLEISGNPHHLDLTATRRLHRRALTAGQPLLLLRQAGIGEPTAASVRLAIEPAAAGPRFTLTGPLEGSIGSPAFRILVEKSRTSAPFAFALEWNRDANAFEERDHDLAAENPRPVAAASADRADLSPAFREIVAFPDAAGNAASGDQPPRGQHAADRGARHAR